MASERTCVGCHRRAPKAELIRLVRLADGSIDLDPAGHTPGRGAYVCSERCFEQAVKRGRLGRALRTEAGTPDFERLRLGFGV